MLRFQTNGSPPGYVLPLMLKGHFENFLPILARNFFHPAAVGKTAFLACLLAVLWLRRRRAAWRDKPTDVQMQPFIWLAGYILLSELGWMALSALGKLPWDISKRWGLSEYGLTALAIPALFCLVWAHLKGRARSSRFSSAGAAVLCAGSLIVGFTSLWVMAKRFDRENIVPEHLYRAMGAIDCMSGNKVILDDGLWPNYRYLTERSGLPIPCGGRLPIEIVRAKDPAGYAALGMTRARPVTYVFGNWDPSFKQGVLQQLRGQGEVKAESFGPADFTSVVTLP